MTVYEIKLPKELLSSLMTESTGFAQLIGSVLDQVLEAQATEQIGADRYERSADRGGYRNGVRSRVLYTRVGPVTLRVPQLRDGAFSTEIFGRYQRSEQAFVLALMEMVLNGVSMRKVTKITEELCGTQFSKSTVSQLCTVWTQGFVLSMNAPLDRSPASSLMRCTANPAQTMMALSPRQL